MERPSFWPLNLSLISPKDTLPTSCFSQWLSIAGTGVYSCKKQVSSTGHLWLKDSPVAWLKLLRMVLQSESLLIPSVFISSLLHVVKPALWSTGLLHLLFLPPIFFFNRCFKYISCMFEPILVSTYFRLSFKLFYHL